MYTLPPEVNLLAVAHYLEALEFQREFIRIHAVLGGKNPHLQTYLVGGMAASMDGNEPNATINPERITLLTELAKLAQTFVQQVYVPDVPAIAGYYRDWFTRGEGLGNFMAYGCYPMGGIHETGKFFFPRGIILGRDLSTVHPLDTKNVSEYVSHSWYEYSSGNGVAKHPSIGETTPKYTGPAPPYERLDTEQKYSWLKAPRYEDKAMEVGPLARTLVAYASGNVVVKKHVDQALAKLNAPASALFSTLGRIAARAIEAEIMADELPLWIAELDDHMANGDVQVHSGEKWDPESWPRQAQGAGFHEAPRGALGHWVEIEDKVIEHLSSLIPWG
jgi:hydrogenase large subunit